MDFFRDMWYHLWLDDTNSNYTHLTKMRCIEFHGREKGQ